MKRLHIHISVGDLNKSIAFYSTMFASEPSVSKSDYAKWMLDNPRVNFAISKRSADLGLNHLGIQVESAEELADMSHRLQNLQADVLAESEAACCYAKSDKYWITDPQGIAWETFHTLDSIPVFGQDSNSSSVKENAACCIPLAKTNETASPCCVPTQDRKTAAGACC